MLRPQLRLPDADTTRTPPWTPVWSSHCCRLLLLLLLLCCYFGVSRTWRMLQSRLLLPAVRYFLNSAPYPFPPLAQRCLSHTQKVVKMQIKLETNWAGRQHTQCSFWRGVHVRMFVCVCLCCCVGRPWGGVFRLSAVLLSAGLAACKWHEQSGQWLLICKYFFQVPCSHGAPHTRPPT